MAANPLAPVDVEINTHKLLLQQLQIRVKGFIASYPSMPAKERAKNLLEIHKTFDLFSRFFDKLKGINIQNTGTKFAAENLKQTYYSLQSQWRKFENSLNSTRAG